MEIKTETEQGQIEGGSQEERWNKWKYKLR